MKLLLLGVIYYYRWLPARFKRRCLFKETCSSFVERVAREAGFWPGLRALRTRVSQCKPGYLVYFDSEAKDWQVRFANGSISPSAHVADFVLNSYREMFSGTRSASPGAPYSSDAKVLTPALRKNAD
jgi:putative component of membrane protein insertase Oxa1/YidC/SpoIIIJ protein YidD